MQAAALKAQEDHLKLVRDRRIQYASDTYGFATAYDNAIVLGGYAAFFGLWAGVNDDLSASVRLASAAFMGASVLFYITWHIIQMITRQKYEFERAGTFSFEDDPARFNKAWEDIERRHARAQNAVIRLWPFIFVPSVMLGLAGAGVLIYATAAMSF